MPLDLPGDSDSWGVITVALKSAVYDSTYKLIAAVLVLTILMIGLVIVCAITFAKNLTQPILELSDAADKIAQGNLNVEVQAAADDEIGDVAKAMNKTVERLKEYINYIDEISDVLSAIADGNLKIDLKLKLAQIGLVAVALLALNKLVPSEFLTLSCGLTTQNSHKCRVTACLNLVDVVTANDTVDE